MAMQPPRVTGRDALAAQLWSENPIFRQVLGICSALAVTNLMFNTLLMCVGLIWTTVMASVTVSAMREYIPKRVRMMVEVLIIAVYVIVVDIVMRATYPDIHRVIGPYVGLIITNCIVMGRLEAFAIKNPVWPSFWDGLGAGLGYSVILLGISLVREALGFGSIFGYPLPGLGAWWRPWTIMVTPPGAFFVLAIAIWASRAYAMRREAAAEQAEEGGK